MLQGLLAGSDKGEDVARNCSSPQFCFSELVRQGRFFMKEDAVMLCSLAEVY